MPLSEDEIRRIALDAAHNIFGATTGFALTLSAGLDWTDAPSYFLDFTMDQGKDRDAAMRRRLSLRREIRDRLVEAGDDTYPYVHVHTRIPAPAVG